MSYIYNVLYGDTVIENLFLFHIETNKTEIGCIHNTSISQKYVRTYMFHTKY